MLRTIALTCAVSLPTPGVVDPPDLPIPLDSLLDWIAAETGRPVSQPRIEAVDVAILKSLPRREATPGDRSVRDAFVELLCPSPPRLAERQVDNDEALACVAAHAGCLFDPTTDTLFVADSAATIDIRALVRELLRAVVHDEVDGDRFASDGSDPDAIAARRMMTNGFSEFLARRVLARRATELAPVLEIGVGDSAHRGAGLAACRASPFFIERSVLELDFGLRFVERAYAESNSDGLRRLLLAPPRSTEQVIDPEKWLGIEPPDEPELPDERDLLTSLPEGSTRAITTALGAFEAEIVLRLGGDPLRAFRAATRFDGDRLVGYAVGESATRLVQWRVRCDDAKDTELWLHAIRKLCEEQLVEPPREAAYEETTIEYDDPITRFVVKRKSDGVARAIAWSDGAVVELLFAREGDFDLDAVAPR